MKRSLQATQKFFPTSGKNKPSKKTILKHSLLYTHFYYGVACKCITCWQRIDSSYIVRDEVVPYPTQEDILSGILCHATNFFNSA